MRTNRRGVLLVVLSVAAAGAGPSSSQALGQGDPAIPAALQPGPGGDPGAPGAVPPGAVPGDPAGGPGPGAGPGAPAPVPPGFKDAPDRYYYGSWDWHPGHQYHFMKLHYKAHPQDYQYAYHYCIRFKSDPTHCYFYDPGKQAYWGCYEYGAKPEASFRTLDPNVVKGDPLSAPPEAIGEPSPLGRVPGAVNATASIIPPPAIPGASVAPAIGDLPGNPGPGAPGAPGPGPGAPGPGAPGPGAPGAPAPGNPGAPPAANPPPAAGPPAGTPLPSAVPQ